MESKKLIMKIRKILFGLLLLLSSFLGISQVKVTGYSIYAMGVSVPLNEKVSGELKIYPNRWIENVDVELAGFYHFQPGDFHRFSAGVGLKMNPFSGENAALVFPVVLEFYPIQSLKRISFLFELAPEIYFDDSINLRYLWGISYSFGKK
jgi:hypothetical protein